MTNDDDGIWDDDESERFKEVLDGHPLAKDYSYGRLVRAVADEARKSPSGQQYRQLNQGLDVVDELMRAVNEDAWRIDEDDKAEAKRKFWYHQEHVQLAGKKRLVPYIPVRAAADVAASYLDLPYRVPALDRILVDMLIASEMFAYADEIQPILKRKMPILLGWLVNNISGFAFGCALAAFLVWIGDGNVVMNWIAGILLAVQVLWTAWSLFTFPFLYPKISAQTKKAEAIIGAMLDTYFALGGTPAYAKHIDERISEATSKGAVWPSQLIVLMEDIRARRQTI